MKVLSFDISLCNSNGNLATRKQPTNPSLFVQRICMEIFHSVTHAANVLDFNLWTFILLLTGAETHLQRFKTTTLDILFMMLSMYIQLKYEVWLKLRKMLAESITLLLTFRYPCLRETTKLTTSFISLALIKIILIDYWSLTSSSFSQLPEYHKTTKQYPPKLLPDVNNCSSLMWRLVI